MTLYIDLGNSALKAQEWRDDVLCYSFSLRLREGWQARFETLLGEVKADHACVASVQQEAIAAALYTSLERFFAPTNITRCHAVAAWGGVRNGYVKPETLGVDRWLCLLGATAMVQRDVIIVDAGSAITIDLLRRDGEHLGGAILPGFNTTLSQFKRVLHTANFDHSAIADTEAPGGFTEACINIDYPNTSPEIIAGLVERWFARLDKDALLIATGGDALRIQQPARHDCQIVPDLVFRGMRRQLESAQ